MADEVKPRTDVVDVDAFDPVPTRKIKIGGELYALFSMLDVPYPTLEAVKNLQRHVEAFTTDAEYIEFMRRIVKDFIPSFPDERLEKLALRKLGNIVGSVAATLAEDLEPDPLAESQSVTSN